MTLQLLGINHKTAPIEVRERLAVPDSRLAEVTRQLVQHPGVQEGMVLSTCNRVEVLAACNNGASDLRSFMRTWAAADPREYEPHLYEYFNEEAVSHLFRVACSLDSMVLGEPQILGQVKDAYAVARAAGAVHSQLDPLVTRAFAVAKRVRTETGIGTSAVSVASVAVELAKRIFGSLAGKHAFLIGVGKMGELAARHLIAEGVTTLYVSNRTHERAMELAQRFNGTPIRFEKLYDVADQADIVISSTGSPQAIFRREHAERFLVRRKHRPIFFIDLAVPRDVSPELNKLDGIFVYDIDDLQQVVAGHLEDRRREAQRAESIIAAEVERFLARRESLDVVPTIISLQEHVENICRAEVERARGRLGKLAPEQELALESLTRGIVNKILHAPITALRTAAREPFEVSSLADLVHRLFNLEKPAQKAKGAARDSASSRS
jgi:glutamyl-tRNA reductase